MVGNGALDGSIYKSAHVIALEKSVDIGKATIHDNPDGHYMQSDNIGFGVAAVPVPGAVWLFGSALTGLGLVGRRKKADSI